MRRWLVRAALLLSVAAMVWLVWDQRWSVVWRSLPFLLRGLGVSWLLTLISTALGMVVGLGLALARLRGPLIVRASAAGFIELVRAVPQLMVIFWVFFTYPALTGGQALSAWAASLLSLTAIAAAYLAEVIRAGLAAVPAVQVESGFASGLTQLQILRFIIVPQALRTMSPALIATFVMMFKVTSLVYVTGLVEFFRAIILVNNRDYAPYPLYITMAGGYLVCCTALSWVVRRMDPRYVLTG
jgi:His/Glu/Gln/Arg/opine family amino acid ABC transporter permease subunit